MANIAVLQSRNGERWRVAKLTRGPQFGPVAKRLVAAKDRYLPISEKTGVPWAVIAVIHEREASQRWDRSIAQGDLWSRVSVHVPKGRGPFNSFEEAAIDALVNCAPYAARWKDWSPGGTMTLLEEYNGLGYATRGLPSPYIWAGTDQYKSGKYVADGVFDANVVDPQLGCAGLLLAMQKIDPSIQFAGSATAPTPPVAPVTGVPVLRKGDKGTDVMRLQDLLNRHGAVLRADGDFGPGTKAAVEIFQTKHGLVVDGIAGRYVMEALKKP